MKSIELDSCVPAAWQGDLRQRVQTMDCDGRIIAGPIDVDRVRNEARGRTSLSPPETDRRVLEGNV